jgi:ribosomal subunit interface protein
MLKTQITGLKIDVTESIREQVNTHFSKLDARFDFIISQAVTFSKSGHLFHVHAEITTAQGNFSAKAESKEFNPMIKDVASKLNRQLLKIKALPSKDSIRHFQEPSEASTDVNDDELDDYDLAS